MSDDLDIHLDAIAAGDAQAFAAWLSGAELVMRRQLRSFAGHVDVEAVLQESLLRVWQVAPKVKRDGRPNALLRLALRIARNHAIDVARRNRSEPLDADALPDAVSSQMPDPLLVRMLRQCHTLLKGPPAMALQQRMLGGGGDSVLAQRAGMTPNTFLKNVGRARKQLLDCLKKHGIEVPR